MLELHHVKIDGLLADCSLTVGDGEMVGVYGEVTLFPPVDSVYHPSNVYPSFVGVCNVTLSPVY